MRLSPVPRTQTLDFFRLVGNAVNWLLDGLSSIVSAEPNDNDILVYNAATEEWQAEAQVFGYTSGGTVTQLTSKATGVTLNKASGAITMNNAALNASTSVSFTLTNSTIAATDNVAVSVKSGATAATYLVGVDAIAAGSCRIHVRNVSGVNQSEAIVLTFTVIKGATA